MKIKVSEATPIQLDWLVAKADDEKDILYTFRQYGRMTIRQGGDHETHDSEWPYSPTTDWSKGGPIIEREGLNISVHTIYDGVITWVAKSLHDMIYAASSEGFIIGPTPLIAAMRCYCCAKLGYEVTIPEELCQQQSS